MKGSTRISGFLEGFYKVLGYIMVHVLKQYIYIYIYTLGPMYEYFKVKVYTIWVHGHLGIGARVQGLGLLGGQ